MLDDVSQCLVNVIWERSQTYFHRVILHHALKEAVSKTHRAVTMARFGCSTTI